MAPVTRQRAKRRRRTLRKLGDGTIPVIDLTKDGTRTQHKAVVPEVIDLTAGTPETTTPDVTDLTADNPSKVTKSASCILDLTDNDSCYMTDDGIDFHSISRAALEPRGSPAPDKVGDQGWWGFWALDPFVASLFPEEI